MSRSYPYTYLRCWEGVVFFAFILDVLRMPLAQRRPTVYSQRMLG